jgi:hypothetical protein
MNKILYMLQKLYYKMLSLIPSSSGRMLNNKWILYFIFAVSLVDVMNFYQRGNLMAVSIFFIVGFLTSFFSKNMLVILVLSIAVTHLVTYGNRFSEGMEDKKEEDEEEEEEEEEEVEEGFEEEDTQEEEEEEPENKVVQKKPTEESMTNNNQDQTSELLKMQKQLMAKMDQLKPLLNEAESMFKTKKTDGFQNMNKMAFSEYR